MTKLCLIFFLICGITFSQNLEEVIYLAAENFIANPNESSLEILNNQERLFKNQINTKDGHLALVFLQCHKANFLNQTGHIENAITTYEEASKRFFKYTLSALSDFDITESCLKPLGNLYTKTGDYTNAISTINQYLFLARQSNNKQHEISGAINLAILYQTMGHHNMVIKITSDYINAAEFNKTQQQKLIKINIDSQIALGTISNNADSISSFDDNTKYKIALDKKKYDEALNYLKKAETSVLKNTPLISRDIAKLYFQEAQLHYLLKNNLEAHNLLQKALKTLLPNFNNNHLPNKESLHAENTFIDIFDLYASLQTNFETALQCLDLSFHVSGLLQNNWTSQENKIQNQAANRLRSETCIDILSNQYNLTKNKDYIIRAFQYAEYNKASVLKEISKKKLQLQEHPNDSLLIKEFNLLKEQERLTSLLINEQLGSSSASKINDLSRELSSISLQIKTLKTAISKKYPVKNNPISIEHLQSSLQKDNATLIEYFYGKNTLYQFIISEKNIDFERIVLNDETKKSISDFIHLFDNASVINNDISAFTKQAYNLFTLLNFDTIKTQKNIVIIPDGLLNFIPFEALLTASTNTAAFSKMPFVVKTHGIAYNSSVLFYLKDIETKNNSRLLGFFPVFENKNQTLTYSIDEANTIQKEMDATLFRNSKASKNNFIKNAHNYSIIHLSTHASSGDFVIPAHIEFYDSRMFLNELYSLNLKSNLVVLSSCETGIGKVYKGEGPMSIARGFQYAGAQNLLFSLWQINDLSTSQIMQTFYKNYNKYHSAFTANHYSKIAYLENESIGNTKKSPYYWSSFVYYGNLEPPKSESLLCYMIFGLLILVVCLLMYQAIWIYYRKWNKKIKKAY